MDDGFVGVLSRCLPAERQIEITECLVDPRRVVGKTSITSGFLPIMKQVSTWLVVPVWYFAGSQDCPVGLSVITSIIFATPQNGLLKRSKIFMPLPMPMVL